MHSEISVPALNWPKYFQSLFDSIFSDNPQIKVKKEAAYVYFMDFIEECEGMTSSIAFLYGRQLPP